MKEKETPGAPPTEPVKPKTSNKDNLSFSLEDLTFIDFFPVEGRKYIRFFVAGEKPAYIDAIYSEYLEYQTYVYEEKGILIAEEAHCICDTTTPILELQDTIETEITVLSENNVETKEKKNIPIYFAYNLVENSQIGNICPTK